MLHIIVVWHSELNGEDMRRCEWYTLVFVGHVDCFSAHAPSSDTKSEWSVVLPPHCLGLPAHSNTAGYASHCSHFALLPSFLNSRDQQAMVRRQPWHLVKGP